MNFVSKSRKIAREWLDSTGLKVMENGVMTFNVLKWSFQKFLLNAGIQKAYTARINISILVSQSVHLPLINLHIEIKL